MTKGSDASGIATIGKPYMMNEEQKIYRVRYEDGWASAIAQRGSRFPKRTEQFSSESEALKRAKELLGAGVHHGVMVLDEAGNALFGLRLDLKLGTDK